MVDDKLANVNKRSNAYLYPGEIVTIGILFALKGVHYRAFYRPRDAQRDDSKPAMECEAASPAISGASLACQQWGSTCVSIQKP